MEAIWFLIITGAIAILLLIAWILFANLLFNEGKFGIASLSPPFVAFYVKAQQIGNLKQKQDALVEAKKKEVGDLLNMASEPGKQFIKGHKVAHGAMFDQGEDVVRKRPKERPQTNRSAK